MAETNQGVFFNPQTENVVGQAYNDLVFSQQERITEEKEAAQLAAAAETAKATAASDAEKERLKLLKEQAKAAQKDADARKKEVSSAIKNIDVVPNAMYKAYAAPLSDAAKYLADNMDQLIEQYGVDKMRIYTEQLNNAGDEIKAVFKTTFNKANDLLTRGEAKAKIPSAAGFIESFSEEDYSSGMSNLNNPDRFKIKFQDGWVAQDAEGNDISFSDWVKAGVTEPSEIFKSKPQMAFSKTVIEAWSKFSLTKNLKQENAMDSFIENQLRDPESVHRLTAMNEYYVNQDPEKALPYDELFGESNAGAERIDEAVQNYKDKWMELYREAVKKEEKTSGSTSQTGEQIVKASTINTDKSDNVKQSLAKEFESQIGPMDPTYIDEKIGVKGIAQLSRDAVFDLTDLDSRNQELFGVTDPSVRVKSLAFNEKGNLFVGFEGRLTPEAAEAAPNDDLLSTYGIVTSPEDKQSEIKGSVKVIEFGSAPWITIMKNVGEKLSNATKAKKIIESFRDIEDNEQVNFYLGMMSVANSTNDLFLKSMFDDIIQEGGITEVELERVLAELNQ